MKTVLVAEDHFPVRTALVNKLKQAGFGTAEACDGEEGLKCALAMKPDLVMLDLIMPKLSGMAMLEKIRKDEPWGANVPVIILTNLNPDAKIMREVIETEPLYYLVKTEWKIEDVVDKVKKLLA